jgi:hypothetical protein
VEHFNHKEDELKKLIMLALDLAHVRGAQSG